MNEWFKKKLGTIKLSWSRWTTLQKVIVAGILVVIIVAIVLMASVSSKPATSYLYDMSVNDENERNQIIERLNRDNVKVYVSQDNRLSVDNASIAKKYQRQLSVEGLAPSRQDPFAFLKETRLTRNDFDDKNNYQIALQKSIKQHLESLEGIQQAEVILSIPEERLLRSQTSEPAASIIIRPAPGSDVTSNKKLIKGIQNLIKRCVEGLKDDGITISDGNTNEQINDFEGMAESDRINNISKQQKEIRKYETELANNVYNQLGSIYGDRVSLTNVNLEMDMSVEKIHAKEYSGITMKPDNPNTPYDDSEIKESLVLSEEKVDKSFTGTGFNPEGPAGVEGQNPPVYSDSQNVIGKSTEKGNKTNYALNEKIIDKETSPERGRRTVSVNIDGTWDYEYDEKNNKILERGHLKRIYKPLDPEQLKNAENIVKGAIGYNQIRGDVVTVTNNSVDRSKEFAAEDAAFIAQLKRNQTIMLSLIGVAVVLVAFILFRVISREIERRRRLAEEARIKEQEQQRIDALMAAQQQGMEVTMSVEERKRAELQEGAVALAKEHPEDVAMLIRTWLMEE